MEEAIRNAKAAALNKGGKNESDTNQSRGVGKHITKSSLQRGNRTTFLKLEITFDHDDFDFMN